MNYIVLEGLSLYLFLILVLLLVLISFACIICTIFTDNHNFMLGELLKDELDKNSLLQKENFKLKLKSGELDIDD